MGRLCKLLFSTSGPFNSKYFALILQTSGLLAQSLTPQFSQLISQLLYTQADLRPAVLKALKVMVESNVVLTTPTSTEDGSFRPSSKISKEEATANLAFLRTQAESWLAVLFNVFSSVNKNSRGMVGDVISVWASITEQQVRLTTLLGI
jgi:ribosomal RNA-processing protein 12